MFLEARTGTLKVKVRPLVIQPPDGESEKRLWSTLLDIANLTHTAHERDRDERAVEILVVAKRELLTLLGERDKGIASPHLTAEESAGYLGISYSTFRKKAKLVRRQPGTGRYRVEDLDEFAASLKPRKKR
ncbi:hypothetical protein J8F10_06510 [Gemmata sp. G18]|uniref:Helix-turn-helix domain-containing protein n=1 Tax=Gemmata palustris TaxID=2822762 RepID=A0ABS5BMJ8_9BACT|nr:hypothetical protein [Gemmata palustris]MBP3954932.1 hypothetical protein [Gemmata palustris]